ncbi:MAG: hypothetical protein WAW85_01900 [Gordonia sp. (in: high G+C Gram-positive bacteria)]|uniref:hypothetical protein n=1 Tax=Gordonia sp. (in: high G+C Gram-positive bacteria) TaxID=84139 RepID=UPI003BB690DE
MNHREPQVHELDIITEHGTVTRLPTSFPLIDPELDEYLDPDLFQKGFDDALEHLGTLPPAWARHFATTTLAQEPDPEDDEPSHTRGFRAGLYGHLRHGTS